MISRRISCPLHPGKRTEKQLSTVVRVNVSKLQTAKWVHMNIFCVNDKKLCAGGDLRDRHICGMWRLYGYNLSQVKQLVG